MPKKQRSELKAGIFVIVALGLLLGVIIWLGASSLFKTSSSRAVFYSDAKLGPQGLLEDGEVQFGDVPIGRIAKITSDIAAGRVLYFVDIEKPGYEVHADGTAKVAAGLLGGSLLVITSLGSDDKPLVDKGKPIRIAGGLDEIIDNMKKISENLLRELDAGNKSSILASIKKIVENMKQIIVVNHDSIDEIFDNMTAVSANLKAASTEIRRNPWRLLYQPDEKKLESANLYDAARAFDAGAQQLETAVTKLKALQQLDPKDPATAKEIQRVRKHLMDTFKHFKKVEDTLWKEVSK